ncbi:hypothetical protein MSAN_00175000 [Mycena sanguinolenta]|uniref:Uncharacterized protein n=1 Tax=Mycena sanguinolenta TaxID=230812 RepID=A0A8H7DJC0_9AGAR|nr:hypothetical protein MSAN_00175000 [Mycena sanguinolenta]
MSLASFPEELLERILLHTVIAPSAPHPRALWHPQSSLQEKEANNSGSRTTPLLTRGRIAPLLVCRAFHRIALPFFYHTLVLHSPRQSASLLHALQARSHLARSVRVLVLPNPSACDAEVLGMLSKLLVLDVTLPSCESEGVEQLGGAIRGLTQLQELRVRKGAGTYLSQPAPRAMLEALAAAVDACDELVSPTRPPSLSRSRQICLLLPYPPPSRLPPALRTLHTPMPALWTPAYVDVATNPSLVRVCLGGEESAMFSAPAVSALECGASSGKESECPLPGKQDRPPLRRLTSPASLQPRPRARSSSDLALPLCRASPRAIKRVDSGRHECRCGVEG